MQLLEPHEYVETDKRRMPYDKVGDYYRSELDRGISGLQSEVWQNLGPSMVRVIKDKYTAQGYISVLDAGCGTGKHLWEMLDRDFENCSNVRLTGVSKEDYSDESEWWMVRAAVTDGTIAYALADLTVDELPSESFDAIYSYEVLTHLEDAADTALRNFLQALAPEGVLFFNASGTQRDQLVATLAEHGGLDYKYASVMPPVMTQIAEQDLPEDQRQTRDVYMVTKLLTSALES